MWQFFTLISTLSFTLTLNVVTVLLISICTLSFVFYVIRYTVLARHSRLPIHEVQHEQGASFDLHPDSTSDSTERIFPPEEIFSNFLSSIRIFGYLDRAVLNELSKSTYQRSHEANKIIWQTGDTSRDFLVVITGCVKIFFMPDSRNSMEILKDRELEQSHLLCEVKAGGTVSSLMDILSIYTDAVDPDSSNGDTSVPSPSSDHLGTQLDPTLDALKSPSGRSFDATKKGSASKIFGRNSSFPSGFSLIAQTSEDTNLLVIPESAFKKLAEKFPRSASQLVQVILSRFQRVTFLTLYKYLGLTRELMNIEMMVNECWGLENSPFSQQDLDILHHLPKRRVTNVFELNKPSALASTLDSSSDCFGDLFKSADANWDGSGKSNQPKPPIYQATGVYLVETAGAGLLDGVNHSIASFRTSSTRLDTFPSDTEFPSDESDEQHLRSLVFDSISKSIGLSLSPSAPSILAISASRSASLNSVNSFDGLHGQPSTSTPPPSAPHFGYLHDRRPHSSNQETRTASSSPINGNVDGLHFGNASNCKILYYEENAILLRQGERNTGLFYVIDGLLEVLMSEEIAATNASTLSKSPSTLKLAQMSELERSQKRLFFIQRGGLAGYLASLTGHPSFVTIRAKIPTFVAYIPKVDMDRIVDQHPQVLLMLAKRLTTKLSPLVIIASFFIHPR